MEAIELIKKPYLNEIEVEAVTGVSRFTLRNNRHLRCGFPYLKIGKRSVRYRTADIVASMEPRRVSFDE